jgi:hypothetical protein
MMRVQSLRQVLGAERMPALGYMTRNESSHHHLEQEMNLSTGFHFYIYVKFSQLFDMEKKCRHVEIRVLGGVVPTKTLEKNLILLSV